MIIGITGTIGAGKNTIADYLAGKGFRHISVSKFLRDEAVKRSQAPTRVHFREIGNEYRARGRTALIEAVLADVNPSKENIIVESLHTVAEVEYVKSLGGKVVSIDAPFAVRYARVQSRHDGKDPSSLDAFVAEEKRQMESSNPDENNLLAAIAAADFHLQNEEKSKELFEKIDVILDRIL